MADAAQHRAAPAVRRMPHGSPPMRSRTGRGHHLFDRAGAVRSLVGLRTERSAHALAITTHFGKALLLQAPSRASGCFRSSFSGARLADGREPSHRGSPAVIPIARAIGGLGSWAMFLGLSSGRSALISSRGGSSFWWLGSYCGPRHLRLHRLSSWWRDGHHPGGARCFQQASRQGSRDRLPALPRISGANFRSRSWLLRSSCLSSSPAPHSATPSTPRRRS